MFNYYGLKYNRLIPGHGLQHKVLLENNKDDVTYL